mmetsp:Transcript_27251/g.65257  ORF Transcript_27251/g.65257 Transcript_27251/m.65257 type:complete len:729 (+) Transcript_27251:145-2331(+)
MASAAAVVVTTTSPELDRFLDTKDADLGLGTDKARNIILDLSSNDEDAPYQSLVSVLRHPKTSSNATTTEDDEEALAAARSYRAMNLRKQDLTTFGGGVGGGGFRNASSGMIIKNPSQASRLAKEMFAIVASENKSRYTTLHLRELLDALLEAYPQQVMSAASAGGKAGISDHLGPLIDSDQTLPALTHLVCYGCTGRKGIVSAEKSAQHTAQLMRSNAQIQISMGQRKKFVMACNTFGLLDRLASALTDGSSSTTSVETGEEVCEAILTIIELIGYPPDDVPQHMRPNNNNSKSKDEVEVGEDVLLSPLAKSEWWSNLLGALQQPTCTPEQRLAISRTCMQAFALTTGNSSRICMSHAPATDATEQTSEKIVEEKEEEIYNRLIEWGLTSKIHDALIAQLPALISSLNLPTQNILDYEATFTSDGGDTESSEEKKVVEEDGNPFSSIRHPGRYRTTPPLGSWRLQLLSLMKEIVAYRGPDSEAANTTSRATKALDAINELPLPAELLKSKKSKAVAENADTKDVSDEKEAHAVYNPWPSLCSLLWAYPHTDFYAIIFFDMLQAVCVEHHEATLRVILQKSKFVSRAIKSLETPNDPLHGILLQCLNLLRLRSQSLPPGAFLPQYLNSHDGWKGFVDKLIERTIIQQTPIKPVDGNKMRAVDIGLGSEYAKDLGLAEIKEFDLTAEKPVENTADANNSKDAGGGAGGDKTSGGKKNSKKKNNKKKKKK